MPVDPSSIRRPELRDLLQIWEARLEGAALPRKARFAPVDVSEFMANMLFVEVSGQPPRFRYREVGVELTRIYGKDVTDRYLDQMPVLFRTFAEPAYREVIQTRDATYGAFRFVENWWIATYERLMLPLTNDGGEIVEVAVAIYPRFVARESARSGSDD